MGHDKPRSGTSGFKLVQPVPVVISGRGAGLAQHDLNHSGGEIDHAALLSMHAAGRLASDRRFQSVLEEIESGSGVSAGYEMEVT